MRFSLAFIVDSVPFTRAVVNGETSLGGSESACVGLARALQARGHSVHLFATKTTPDALGRDAAGVVWHDLVDFAPMNQFMEWDVVCALRAFNAFHVPMQARQRWLWNQDLLVPGHMQQGVMAFAWAYDQIAYVSEYHRLQWEDLQPELKAIGWVTRNGIECSLIPQDVPKDPNRIIHISRPERGLGPLLNLWPLLKARHPEATLQVCRYSSMYDTGVGSWTDVCQSFDQAIQVVNEQVGGITYLGELTKPQLYQAISEAAVMWYPGVSTFAETNCIAATEANACGTPFVGSLKGALPDTARPSFAAGLLIPGVAENDDLYAERSVSAVVDLLKGCRTQSRAYRELQQAGRAHAADCDFAILAEEWDTKITANFQARYDADTPGVLRQLLHDDDHTAAKIVAHALGDQQAEAYCDYIIAGKDQTAEQYGANAIQDVLYEAKECARFRLIWPLFEGCRRVLDVACGNGSFAISLALHDPVVTVHGLDYSAHNIDLARAAAIESGVSDRCTFEQRTIYDFDRQGLHDEWTQWTALPFDGLFVGEFLEHVAGYQAVIDGLEDSLEDGARVVYTCPAGAFVELLERGMPVCKGHVHRFKNDDLAAVFGPKDGLKINYMHSGWSRRGTPIGHWIIDYVKRSGRQYDAGERPYAARLLTTRPMPRLTVGLLTKNVENDLGRCLSSIWHLADEILVGDTGSWDATKAIAESYGARVIDLAPIEQQPEGFAGARNAVLADASGEWFLWIDADEQLLGAMALRKYLEGSIFHGYVIHQNHLQVDAPNHFDIPVRLFRTRPDVRFYGCVHEQPQMGDANGDIYPSLDAGDLQLIHTGYLTEEVRRTKMLDRNLPLLQKDFQVFPERELGKVLLLRESVLQADRHRDNAGGLTAVSERGYAYAIKLFLTYFSDPGNKHHHLARPWYHAALKALGLGYEMEIAIAGKKGSMNGGRASAERIMVADGAEFEAVMAFKTAELAKKMRPPTCKTDPFVLPVIDEVPA